MRYEDIPIPEYPPTLAGTPQPVVPPTPVETAVEAIPQTGTGDMIVFLLIFAAALIVIGLLGRWLGRKK